MLRLGSPWDTSVDYRVYRLQNESWAGLWLASRCSDCDGVSSNRELLGLGLDAAQAVRVALDFYNWDLEARGEAWRLNIHLPAVPPANPIRA